MDNAKLIQKVIMENYQMEIILCWWNVETDKMELSKNYSATIMEFLRNHSNERTLD